MKRALLSASLSLAALLPQAGAAVTVLQDTFSGTNPITGAEIHPNVWLSSGGTAVESGGRLSVSTATNSTQYSQAPFGTRVDDEFNLFTQTLTIAVDDFALAGTGVNASTGQNFRLGLIPSNTAGTVVTSFYSAGDDGVALNIINGNQFNIRYKADSAVNTDPNIPGTATTGVSSGTLPFTITSFVVSFSATNWTANFFGAGGTSSLNSGTWNLMPFQSTWGNAGDGLGNSALLTYAQNGTLGTGNVTYSMSQITVTSSIPEPATGLLLFGGVAMATGFRRRRLSVR